MGTNGAMVRRAMRLGLALLLLLTAACSGSGASVGESDLSGAQGTKKVTPTTPDDPTPVTPTTTTTFVCKTGSPFYDGAVHSVTFSLRGDELASRVTAEPPTSMLGELDSASQIAHTDGKFVLDGANGDAELVLYDNSDMTKGYVVVDHKQANVFCTKT